MTRRFVFTALSCLFFAAFTGPALLARAQVPQDDIVATLEVELPDIESFLLRGTLPVPRNTHHPMANAEPLVVVLADGSAAPTQVEAVTSYARDAHGSEVVELIARVQRPPGSFPGDRVRFDVARMPHQPRPLELDPDIQPFFDGSATLVLRTRDVFGNDYRADLLRDVRVNTGEAVVARDGELCHEVTTHEIMRPTPVVQGSQGTLPRMMGVHADMRFWADEPFFSLDLHVHNGMDGNDPNTPLDDALDKIYFEALELELPRGWQLIAALPNPALGQPFDEAGERVWPIVRGESRGKMHVMGRQARFLRRFVVAKEGFKQRAAATLREHTLGFCVAGQTPSGDERWSWWNEETARYYPQSHRLPSLDHVGLATIRNSHERDLRRYSSQIARGSDGGYPFTAQALGWAHPWGIRYGGMTGSDEIWIYDGVTTAAAASQAGYRLTQLQGRAYIDRQPTALIHKTGRPTHLEDWLNPTGLNGPWMPMYFNLEPSLPNNDPFGFTSAPTFQSDAVRNLDLQPSYEARLLSFEPIDHQHYVRYTRSLKTMIWLGNDTFSKRELELTGELFRLSFHEYPNSNYGHIQGSGLLAKMIDTSVNPGQGLAFGRGEAWALDATLGAYASGSREVRARYYPWLEKIAKVLADGQADCTGCIQAWASTSYFSGQYRVRQSFENAIIDNALLGLRKTAFEGRSNFESNRLKQVLVDSVYGSISPLFWNALENAPWSYAAVGPFDDSQPLYCTSIPQGAYSVNVDRNQFWSSLAYAFEVNGDPEFLRRALQMTGSTDLYDDLMGTGLANLGNRAGLLALLQGLR